jgi:hypothetical protein
MPIVLYVFLNKRKFDPGLRKYFRLACWHLSEKISFGSVISLFEVKIVSIACAATYCTVFMYFVISHHQILDSNQIHRFYCGHKVNSCIGLSYRPAKVHGLAGQAGIRQPYVGVDLIPQSGDLWNRLQQVTGYSVPSGLKDYKLIVLVT